MLILIYDNSQNVDWRGKALIMYAYIHFETRLQDPISLQCCTQ